MNRRLPAIIVAILVGIMILIVLHAPMSVGLGVIWPDWALIIKSWKEIAMVFASCCLVVLVSRKRYWGALARDRLFWVIIAYTGLVGVLAMLKYIGIAPTLAGLMIDLRYVLYFALVYTLLRLYPHYQAHFLRAGLIGAVIVIGFGVMQLFLPHDILRHIGYSVDTIAPYGTVDRNYDFIRINSTLRGPNPLGAYTIMTLVAARQRRRHTWIAAGATIASVIVLWLSYSRSAAIGALIAVGIVLVVRYWSRIPKLTWAGIGVGLIIAGAVVLMLGRSDPFISNVVFHEDPGEGGMIDSNEAHVDSLASGAWRMLTQPWGGGIGSTGSASLLSDQPLIIENQYLFVAHETGWLGLGLFVTLSYMVMYRLWRYRRSVLGLTVFASGVGLIVIGLLLPVWADDTVSIVWWGLAAVVLARGDDDGAQTADQKTT